MLCFKSSNQSLPLQFLHLPIVQFGSQFSGLQLAFTSFGWEEQMILRQMSIVDVGMINCFALFFLKNRFSALIFLFTFPWGGDVFWTAFFKVAWTRFFGTRAQNWYVCMGRLGTSWESNQRFCSQKIVWCISQLFVCIQ